MGDWNLPALTATYADFLTYLGARDFDAISLGVNSITNPQAGMMRYVRASNRFQEYDGTTWQDKILSVAGGGTGANTAAGARTSLGLGSIASQDANNVAITGGNASGLGSLVVNGNTGVGGDLDVNGVITTGSGGVALTDASGKIPAIDSSRFTSLSGANLTGFTAAQIPALDAAKITTGVIAVARLGTGTPSAATFLRGDGTWSIVALAPAVYHTHVTLGAGETIAYQGLSGITDCSKAYIVPRSHMQPAYGGVYGGSVRVFFVDSSNVEVTSGAPAKLAVQVLSDPSSLSGSSHYFDVVAWT